MKVDHEVCNEFKLDSNEMSMIRWLCGSTFKEGKKIQILENYWDWNLWVWWLNGTDYCGLDMFNIKVNLIRSSSVYQWRLNELDWGSPKKHPVGILSRTIWRVSACQWWMRMLRISTIVEWKSRGQLINQSLPGKQSLKWCTCEFLWMLLMRMCLVYL